MVPSVIQWFEQVQKDWTTPNSWETTLCLVSPIVQWFDPQSYSGSSRCRWFELPRSRVKLPYGPGFLNHAVVRAGSEGLNYPELLRNYPTGQVSSVKLWFEQVQENWTTPNSLETTMQARFTRSYSGSSRFRRVELLWTFEKLPYRPGFLVVRAGSGGLNYPELLKKYPRGKVSSVVQSLEQFQEDWTTPNSCETTL